MTTTIEAPVRRSTPEVAPPPLLDEPLSRCLGAALDAADAADHLGLDSHPLRAAHDAGVGRGGFPGDAYVLAFVGGTGVGKSTLLNALAGDVVSRASALRPTTSTPIAWVPRTERVALEPLLDWLDVGDVRDHDATDLGPVAILDLPDMDSVAGEHRARVEALLPVVDAVAWVTDPEKYADAVLHDEFLRSWLPRLGRQVVLVNKSDRVTDADSRRIQRDLEADIASGAIRGAEVAVLLTSAASPDGIGTFRAWLAAGAEGKRVARGRIAASLVAAARDLAWAAGDGYGRAGLPVLDDDIGRATV
jgi:GTP-binding protein EngB required for normal cell division